MRGTRSLAGQSAGSEVDPRWYRDLVESAPDAVVLIDNNGRVVLVNGQTEKLFGFRREELVGQPVEVLIPERYRKRHGAHRNSYFGEPKVRGMGAGIELWGLRQDGTEFPVEISLSPLHTDRGTFATASIRDISDRRKAEARFRTLLETAPDAMVIINRAGLIELVNEQAERVFGYARAELIGQSVEMLVPERLRDKHVGHRSGYFANPKVRPMGAGLELWGQRKNGEEFPIEISLSPMETPEGRFATAAVRDISDRKAVEEKLARYAENLKQSNEELEQFAYVASHDLQAPLRNVVSFTQLLEHDYRTLLDRKGLEYLHFIVQSGLQMQSLIRDLLAFSRVGRQDSELVAVDCEEVFRRVLVQLKTVIEDRAAQVTHDPLPRVQGVAHELNQLLQNLITNGIKFQPGDTPRVHVSAGREGPYLRFSVRDWGIGIKPEHHKKIFQIFQRLHTQKEYEGTGIGLALCQKIVTRHGGRIWVESDGRNGTTVHFTLMAAG